MHKTDDNTHLFPDSIAADEYSSCPETEDPSETFSHEHDTDGHHHTHSQTKVVLNRLSRAIGHLESVKRMVEDGRDCTEVLVQLAAVRSALNSTAKVILKDHLEHCILDAKDGGEDQLLALNDAIDKYIG